MSIISDILDWFSNITRHDDHDEVTVKKGDNLSEIAEQFGHAKEWHQIVDLNPGVTWDKEYTIHPGQVLKIPRGWID